MTVCKCGHGYGRHYAGTDNCFRCDCEKFAMAEDQTGASNPTISNHREQSPSQRQPRVEPEVDPQDARMERIAVALESIARSLDAMRRDGR